MIPETVLARIVESSGVRDKNLVTLDVLSVYLLEELGKAGMLEHMCFKGGNSLRKIFARRPSRFSRDLDFVDASYLQISDAGLKPKDYYFKLLERLDGQTYHDVHWQVSAVSDGELGLETLHVDLHFFVYGRKAEDGWNERKDNVLALQCSFRRPVLLPPKLMLHREESWFKHLEFSPQPVQVLQLEEAIAEKVRAAFQRTNPRDVYDLNDYGALVFNKELARSLVVLKCWEDRGLYTGKLNFDPEELFDKLRADSYNWDQLRQQISPHAWMKPEELVASVRKRYKFLSTLSESEKELCLDKGQKNIKLHDKIWDLCRNRAL